MIFAGYRKPAAALYAATCLMWFSIYFYIPILGPYCEGMGVSYTMVGTILSSYGFVLLVLRVPVGVMSDSKNKRKIFMIAGMLSSVISGLGFFFAVSPVLLLCCRALAGVTASTWAIYMVSYGGFFPASQQSKSIGVIGTSMFAGQVIATFLGGIVATTVGERQTFLISAIAGAAGILLLMTIPEPATQQKEPPKPSDFVALLKNWDLIFFSLMAVILQITVYSGALGFIPNVLRSMGANNFTLGLSTTFATLLAIATSYFSGTFFEEKVGARTTLIAAFIVTALANTAMAFSKSIEVLLFLVLIIGAPRGVLQSMLNSLAIRGVRPEVRSSAASLFQSIYGFGMTIGPIIAGAIADAFSMTAAFASIGILTLSAVVFILLKKKWPTWVS
ncbi:MAG: MFS transporter [Oscillospiraceae bacterium]|nr:MFS transporter [Oscillospiraceae bacterium]